MALDVDALCQHGLFRRNGNIHCSTISTCLVPVRRLVREGRNSSVASSVQSLSINVIDGVSGCTLISADISVFTPCPARFVNVIHQVAAYQHLMLVVSHNCEYDAASNICATRHQAQAGGDPPGPSASCRKVVIHAQSIFRLALVARATAAPTPRLDRRHAPLYMVV